MSSTLIKTLSYGIGRLAQSSKGTVPSLSKAGNILYGGGSTVTNPRSLTRSIWHMCRPGGMQYSLVKPASSKTCGCCEVHTDGDKELSSFLTEEIGLEKKSEKTPGKLPAVRGFDVVSTDGADIVLQKKENNEILTIRLNVNGTVDDDAQLDGDDSKNVPEAQMVSKPPFVVEINKSGAMTLGLQCTFPPPEEAILETADGSQQYEDLIEIQEVTLLSKSERWEDNTYSVQGSILDGNLYNMLINMMEERGITAEFVDQLVEFSTAYEHRKYISFLEGLKDFANQK